MTTPRYAGLPMGVNIGGVKMAFNIGIFAMFTFLSGYVILWSDQHNNARYITREEYAKDRASDESLRITRDGNIQARLSDQKAAIDSIAQDVKQLLRESRK